MCVCAGKLISMCHCRSSINLTYRLPMKMDFAVAKRVGGLCCKGQRKGVVSKLFDGDTAELYIVGGANRHGVRW